MQVDDELATLIQSTTHLVKKISPLMNNRRHHYTWDIDEINGTNIFTYDSLGQLISQSVTTASSQTTYEYSEHKEITYDAITLANTSENILTESKQNGHTNRMKQLLQEKLKIIARFLSQVFEYYKRTS